MLSPAGIHNTNESNRKGNMRNTKRRKAALSAIRAHATANGSKFEPHFMEGNGYIQDLLADLMHLCDLPGMPEFKACLRMAGNHHEAELKGE
jgi:hypothetical protein